MSDLSTAIKSAVLAALDGSPAVTALVPAGRIFPRKVESKPAYPFLRYEGNARAYETTCGSGSEIAVRIHAFATGEETCEQIAAAVVSTLEAATGFQSCDWERTQYLMDDDEADIWHAVIDFSVIHTV